MTREMIITELQNRGYKAVAQSSIKNGVEVEGVCIRTESPIAPIIYTEELIRHAEEEGKSLDDVVSAIGKLQKTMSNMDRPSYNINGVTYNEGSDVSEAIKTLVNAVVIEGRV